MSKNKKAIITIGDGPAPFMQYGNNPVPTGPLDLGIKGLSIDEFLVPTIAGLSNLEPQDEYSHDSFSTGVSFNYPLAKEIKDSLHCEELLVIPLSSLEVSWRYMENDFRELTEILAMVIRHVVEVLGHEIVGVFWTTDSSGVIPIFFEEESDEESLGTLNEEYFTYILDSIVMTIRDVAEAAGQAAAASIPVITGDIAHGNLPGKIKEAFEGIGERIPFATYVVAEINLSEEGQGELPFFTPYDSQHFIRFGHLLYEGWEQARRKSNGHHPQKGKFLLHRLSDQALYEHPLEALHAGGQEHELKYSRLGETWKYRKHKKYKFLLEYDVMESGESGSYSTHTMTFEQAFIPYMFEAHSSAASLIAKSEGAKFGDGFAGFPGMHYKPYSDCLMAMAFGSMPFMGDAREVPLIVEENEGMGDFVDANGGFYGGDDKVSYLPCGLAGPPEGAPILAFLDDEGNLTVATEIRLYAIVD